MPPTRAFSKTRGRIGWLLFALVAYVVFRHFSDGHSGHTDDPVDDSEQIDAGGELKDAMSGDWPLAKAGVPDAAEPAGGSRRNYYVILDASRRSRKALACLDGKAGIDSVVASLSGFENRLPAQTNLGLAVFDHTGLSERVALGTQNRPEFAQALHAIRPGRGAPLKSAIQLGYRQLQAQARQDSGRGEYHLVLLSAAPADPDSQAPQEAEKTLLEKSPIVLHIIDVCGNAEPSTEPVSRLHRSDVDSREKLDVELANIVGEPPLAVPGSPTPAVGP